MSIATSSEIFTCPIKSTLASSVATSALAPRGLRFDRHWAVTQFRPNLAITDVEAATEDSWRQTKVGECEPEITKQCKRCVFATINPETRIADADQGPFRTLTSYRRHPEGGVAMGVYAIRRTYRVVSVGDTIKVFESVNRS